MMTVFKRGCKIQNFKTDWYNTLFVSRLVIYNCAVSFAAYLHVHVAS